MPRSILAGPLVLAFFALPASGQVPKSGALRASIGTRPVEGLGPADDGGLSANGRLVIFTSTADNLVEGDTNGVRDVFVRDVKRQHTERVSLGPDGELSTDSGVPALSANGRVAAFELARALGEGPAPITDIVWRRRKPAASVTVSLAPDGSPADGPSRAPSLSANGRFVAYDSDATNLVAGDTNDSSDVFVHDTKTGESLRVSVASDGSQAQNPDPGTAHSTAPSLSGNGRLVAFHSEAGNLVAGDDNGQSDVFLHDTKTGETLLVSAATDGSAADGASTRPSISRNGRFVAFQSAASDLVDGDTNESVDVFVRDLKLGTTTRVSVTTSGAQVSGDSSAPALSANGRRVAFTSAAAGLVVGDDNGVADVFVHDLKQRTTVRGSLPDGVTDPEPGLGEGSSHSSGAALSANGRRLAFTSTDPDLVPGDTNRVGDVFVRDLKQIRNERASVGPVGVQGNGASSSPAVSDNGRAVVFQSVASNLVVDDTNEMADVFLHDLKRGVTTRISVAEDGTEGDGLSLGPRISSNGRYVSFHSGASNLVPDDTNEAIDVFLYDAKKQTIQRVSVTSGGGQASGPGVSTLSSLSGDGQLVAFQSSAEDLLPGDTNTFTDIFVRDLKNELTIRVSLPQGGGQANGNSSTPVISSNGKFVVYRSSAKNLVPGDSNNIDDIFLADLELKTTRRVSLTSAGNQIQLGGSCQPFISATGRYVCYRSESLITPGDTNEAFDIFLFDTETGFTQRVSEGPNAVSANEPCYAGSITANGRWVLYYSFASNLVTGDTNGARDVFLFDRKLETVERLSVDAAGGQLTGDSFLPTLTANGKIVGFTSKAAIDSADSNGADDIYLRRR